MTGHELQPPANALNPSAQQSKAPPDENPYETKLETMSSANPYTAEQDGEFGAVTVIAGSILVSAATNVGLKSLTEISSEDADLISFGAFGGSFIILTLVQVVANHLDRRSGRR